MWADGRDDASFRALYIKNPTQHNFFLFLSQLCFSGVGAVVCGVNYKVDGFH